MTPIPPILTVDEVAVVLRVTPQTVRVWIREGKLEAARPGGPDAPYRIRRSVVLRKLIEKSEA